MKRFASLVTVAALAGSLVGAAATARADSTMYLVPISDISKTYSPGAKVQFAVVLNLGVSTAGFLFVPTAVAYTTSEFARVNSAASAVVTSAQEDPTNSGLPFWTNDAKSLTTTASVINGWRAYTVQDSVAHTATPIVDADGKAIGTVTVPAGIYTIATFTLPIAAIAGGSASVYLPTPFGFSNSANATDGAYQYGNGPLFSLDYHDVNGNFLSEPLSFPASGSKLTFKVNGFGPGSGPGIPAIPTTTITGGPAEGASVAGPDVTFSFTGNSTTSPTSRLKYIYTVDSFPFPQPLYATSDTSATLTGLGLGAHTFRVAAVDPSDYYPPGYVPSNVAVRHFNVISGPTPVISDVRSGVPTDVAVTISWTTDIAATTQAAYRIAGATTFTRTALDSSLAPFHGVTLTGLTANTKYEYYVISANYYGVSADTSSNLRTFQTLPRTAMVTGRVAFEGVADLTAISPSAPLGTLHFSFRYPGTTTELYGYDLTLTPDSSNPPFGGYAINGVPFGAYDLVIKSGKNLSVLISNVQVSAATPIQPDITLPAGDANNDNSVDSSDFTLLIGSFNSEADIPGTGYDARADLNYDGFVDSSDFTLLINEFNNTGQ